MCCILLHFVYTSVMGFGIYGDYLVWLISDKLNQLLAKMSQFHVCFQMYYIWLCEFFFRLPVTTDLHLCEGETGKTGRDTPN